MADVGHVFVMPPAELSRLSHLTVTETHIEPNSVIDEIVQKMNSFENCCV